MKPPADVMSSYLKKEGDQRFDNTFLLTEGLTSTSPITTGSEMTIKVNQKSTKVMEDELKNLQEKISDLENKLCVTTTTAYSKDARQQRQVDTDSEMSEEQPIKIVKRVEIKENQNRTFDSND